MGKTYHELNPLIRVKELELLSKKEFQLLLAAKNLQEIGEILKSTVYADYISQNFELTFEQNLDQQLAKLYDELLEIVPEPEVVWIYTMRYTFHNLKVLTKAEFLGENFDHLFIDDGFYSLKEVKRAIHTMESTQLPEPILATIAEVKAYYAESNNLQGIDIIYDRRYLHEQLRVGQALGYPELLEEITSFIDLTNLVVCGRCLLQKRSYAFMSSVLSSAGQIEKADLLQFSKQTLTQFADFLLTTQYRELAITAMDDGKLDLSLFEKNKDNFLTERYELATIQAFGPLPLLAFLNAKEVEIKNLRLLIVGKANGFTNEQLKERVRETYDA